MAHPSSLLVVVVVAVRRRRAEREAAGCDDGMGLYTCVWNFVRAAVGELGPRGSSSDAVPPRLLVL